MKARPRSVERKVAEHLSAIFQSIGYGAVERIPVLGRTGPDITINEFGLVIDVKSRLCVPKCFLHDKAITLGDLVSVPLNKFADLTQPIVYGNASYSVMVQRWLDHMAEWTYANRPGGIPALILHRPGMPVGKSVLVIYSKDRKEFSQRWKFKLSTSE